MEEYIYKNKNTLEEVSIIDSNGRDAFFQLINIKHISSVEYDNWELLAVRQKI